jgi:hypothetical protein
MKITDLYCLELDGIYFWLSQKPLQPKAFGSRVDFTLHQIHEPKIF